MKTLSLLGCTAVALFAVGCGDYAQTPSDSGTASLNLSIWITKPDGHGKRRRALETSWQRLIIRISGPGMDTIRDTTAISMDQSLYESTLDGIAPGDDRLVEGWTENGDGVRIHYGSVSLARLDPGDNEVVTLTLDPFRGSIYIHLAEVPTTVDSVLACFVWAEDSLHVRQRRAGLMEMSIDNVPDGADGRLFITALGAEGDTLYADTVSLVFDVGVDASMRARFDATPAGLTAHISLVRPGATVISGFMDTAESTGPESGPLIISEIMYYAVGDSDYIEIHNPTDAAVVLDTMVLEVVETSSRSIRYILHVNIEAGGYLVVGDSDAPREGAAATDWNIDTTVVYNLTTTGRWILLKARQSDGSPGVIDWVAYSGDDEQGWPSAGSRHAIELDSLPTDPEYNNYGCNWIIATREIGTSGHYGTPGH